jgi:hypothetical protein
MMRILIVETASPRRVRQKSEEILAGGVHAEPQITILCKDDPATVAFYGEVPQLRVVPLRGNDRRRILKELRRRRFDLLLMFWTGEKKYRHMKWRALRMGARSIDVDSGDGSVFRLTWKSLLRFLAFRWKHPLPGDHWEFVPDPDSPLAPAHYPGEKILVVQSAEPAHVLEALERLGRHRLFYNPRYTLFCRNKPEVIRHFLDHPMISEVRPHTEARNSWTHLRRLRRERYDALVLFLTGDPSYWKIKHFAFLLGARHKVIFNENHDCFYFSWRAWLSLLAHRLRERTHLGTRPGWADGVGLSLFMLLKVLVLPFRFSWLLLVWLRLRSASSRVRWQDDRSL